MRGAALGALVSTAGSGCSRPAPAHNGVGALVDVTYVTGFGSFGREAFAWVAAAKGFFSDVGLKVTIVAGAAGNANLDMIGSNRAQFAEIDYSGALVRVGNGVRNFRCVAALNQQTLIALMALEGQQHRVIAPKDLEGRTVGYAAGAVPFTLFPAYAGLAKINAGAVKWVTGTPQQLPLMLASGAVDAVGQFVAGAPALQHAAGGRSVVTLPYSDYLTDLYGNVLVTSTRLAKEDPGLVLRFTGALLWGLQDTVRDPEGAARILHAAVPAMDEGTAAAEIRLLKPYIDTVGTLGAFDPVRVARSVAVLQSLGLYPSGFDPVEVVDFSVVRNEKVSPSR